MTTEAITTEPITEPSESEEIETRSRRSFWREDFSPPAEADVKLHHFRVGGALYATVCTIRVDRETCVYGAAFCSAYDRPSAEIGRTIARGRAEKSLWSLRHAVDSSYEGPVVVARSSHLGGAFSPLAGRELITRLRGRERLLNGKAGVVGASLSVRKTVFRDLRDHAQAHALAHGIAGRLPAELIPKFRGGSVGESS